MLLNQPTNQPTQFLWVCRTPCHFMSYLLSSLEPLEAEGSRFVGGKLSGWWLEPLFFLLGIFNDPKIWVKWNPILSCASFSHGLFEPPS